jgi:DNA-binding response OmpR family regulator
MRILIVDDSPIITRNIALYLEQKGYVTTQAANGEEAFDLIGRSKYDCIVLDRMMPWLDGMGLVRLLRSRSITTPIVFLTALGKPLDRIEGLSLGVDDYLVKPFELEELELRVRNIIARSQIGKKGQTVGDPVSMSLNQNLYQVQIGEQKIHLSPREFELLAYLHKNSGLVFSRDQIYEAVWGEDSSQVDSLDMINVHIANLRKKLPVDCIKTIKHQGFTFETSKNA